MCQKCYEHQATRDILTKVGMELGLASPYLVNVVNSLARSAQEHGEVGVPPQVDTLMKQSLGLLAAAAAIRDLIEENWNVDTASARYADRGDDNTWLIEMGVDMVAVEALAELRNVKVMRRKKSEPELPSELPKEVLEAIQQLLPEGLNVKGAMVLRVEEDDPHAGHGHSGNVH